LQYLKAGVDAPKPSSAADGDNCCATAPQKPNETPGLDNSVVATKYPGLFQISTTDFFYPLVEDPYLQGRIAACNVLSDLYAMGVTEIDTTLMLIAASMDMTAEERDIVTTLMMKGYRDTAALAGTSVTGGQTVQNPWPIIGGVGISLRHESEFVRPGGLRPGDVMVLTKPLGTQVAVNAWQWRGGKNAARWETISSFIDLDGVAAAYNTAVDSMCRLNINAAKCLKKHGCHGATDVTGFGIYGHAANLAQYNEAAEVSIILHSLPCIANMAAIDSACGSPFKLKAGRSAETSGGLLAAFPDEESAEAFIKELSALDNRPAWIVGEVVPRLEGLGSDGEPKYAVIKEDVAVVEVPLPPPPTPVATA
jgi:selenide, water dikinase